MSDPKTKPPFFLRTKLLPPRPVADFLPRPRLTSKLEANLAAPITLVAADAGFGKTTLISEFLRDRDIETVWYQLDHTDGDPFAFVGYLTAGIAGIKPDFGKTVVAYLNDSKEEFLQHPERAVDLLLNEVFEHFEQPFVLVLDDYHHIGPKTIVHKMVDRLLLYSSDIIHIIITTRDLPPLAIARHRSQSSALVITRDELLFTDEEVQSLFKETLDADLTKEEIEEYREKTQGWVTALQLVRQVAERERHAKGVAGKVDLKEILHRSERDIFEYFAEEVFSREDDQTKDTLLHLALLESMPLELCSRVFPDKRCAAVLPELAQKNVFVTIVGDEEEEYRMHPLFRGFLLRRLRSEAGRTMVAEERLRIAEFFLNNNDWASAIPYLLEAEAFQKAAEVLAEKGEEWLDEGKITTLNIYTERIPVEALEEFPRSLLYLAEAKRHQGDFDKSYSILNLAVNALKQKKDVTGEAEANYSLASLARRKGNTEEAFEFLDLAEKLVPDESETFMKCANTRGLCFAMLGDWSKSEQLFRLALELANKLGNDKFARIAAHNLAIPTGFRGEFSEALRWLRKMFRDEKQPLPQEAYGYLNVGRMHLYRGEFEQGLKSLKRSLELCQTFNMKPIRGEIFEALGHYYRDTGDFQKAVEYFESSRKAYDDAGVNRFRQEVEEEYSIYFQMRGDIAKARALLENLLEERKRIDYDFGVKRVELGLAAIKLSLGETKGLIKELEVLHKYHRKQSFNYEEAQNALVLAKAYQAEGKRKEMFRMLQRTLDLTARYDYEYWLKTEIQKSPEFFRDDDIVELLPVDLRDVLVEPMASGKVNSVFEHDVVMPISDLTVNLLGSIEIYRDPSNAFSPQAWTTRRARDIFACIASSKHKRVGKDVLIDLFWAEDDLESVEKNFHPTISHIRKALNSQQPAKMNFIVFRDGAYQLNPDFTYAIDTEIFEDRVTKAEKAKREKDNEEFRKNSEAACELYRGEFMTGVYDDWAEERRSYFAEQFARVVTSLAELAFDEENWPDVQKYSKDVLRYDPYREDIHRLIMKSHAKQGNDTAVRNQFSSLQTLLEKDLGVGPSPESIRIYRELIG